MAGSFTWFSVPHSDSTEPKGRLLGAFSTTPDEWQQLEAPMKDDWPQQKEEGRAWRQFWEGPPRLLSMPAAICPRHSSTTLSTQQNFLYSSLKRHTHVDKNINHC